jgi:hypothetical protein
LEVIPSESVFLEIVLVESAPFEVDLVDSTSVDCKGSSLPLEFILVEAVFLEVVLVESSFSAIFLLESESFGGKLLDSTFFEFKPVGSKSFKVDLFEMVFSEVAWAETEEADSELELSSIIVCGFGSSVRDFDLVDISSKWTGSDEGGLATVSSSWFWPDPSIVSSPLEIVVSDISPDVTFRHTNDNI